MRLVSCFRKRFAHIVVPRITGWFVSAIVAIWTSVVFAADADQIRALLLKGDYAECITAADQAIQQRVFGEEWYLLKSEAEMQQGRYQDAFETVSGGLTRYAWSIRLRQAGIEPACMSGKATQGKVWQAEISDIVMRAAWRYEGDAESLVALGKVAAATGADARQVLETFYDRASRCRSGIAVQLLRVANWRWPRKILRWRPKSLTKV